MRNNILDQIISVIVGTVSTIAKVPGLIADGLGNFNDFIYVRYYGLPFIVLGARQTGKTTLIEWLRHGTEGLEGFEPSPTAGGGDVVPRFNSRIADDTLRTNIQRDVGGEHAMWETDWVELFKTAQPAGIIFMLDHLDRSTHKEALNFVLQMIDEDERTRKNLRALMILVNKSDLWDEETTLETLLDDYKNEMRRARLLTGRYGLWFEVHGSSLVEGRSITGAMQGFLNAIRPKPRKVIPVVYE
jgi:hypothetical protein